MSHARNYTLPPIRTPRLSVAQFTSWTTDELIAWEDAAVAVAAEVEADAQIESDRKAAQAALPKLKPPVTIRAKIAARQAHRDLWMQAKGPDDFERALIERLLRMLNVARASHDPDECDRLEAELRAIGAESPV